MTEGFEKMLEYGVADRRTGRSDIVFRLKIRTTMPVHQFDKYVTCSFLNADYAAEPLPTGEFSSFSM